MAINTQTCCSGKLWRPLFAMIHIGFKLDSKPNVYISFTTLYYYNSKSSKRVYEAKLWIRLSKTTYTNESVDDVNILTPQPLTQTYSVGGTSSPRYKFVYCIMQNFTVSFGVHCIYRIRWGYAVTASWLQVTYRVSQFQVRDVVKSDTKWKFN